MSVLATIVSFPTSTFPPLALGFFGLGTGYLIYGPQELLGFPARDKAVDLATGIWGVWMPGFMQFLAGTYLFVGLVWFHSFTEPPLYAAALAFTAYGVHWFAIGLSRSFGGDARPNAFMSIAFTIISVLGIIVFFHAKDWEVGGLFIGLTCIYVGGLLRQPGERRQGPGDAGTRVLSPRHRRMADVPVLRRDARLRRRVPLGRLTVARPPSPGRGRLRR